MKEPVISSVQQAIANLTRRTYTWLDKHINQNRTRNSDRRQYKEMTKQFKTTLKTCYKNDKVSKKEMRMAKKQWKEAMKKVKKEDKRRGKLWSSINNNKKTENRRMEREIPESTE